MEGVLKGLQPHNNLIQLHILRYPGKTISLEIIPGLRSLDLCDCPNLKALPTLSELQFLESIHINGVKEMKHEDSNQVWNQKLLLCSSFKCFISRTADIQIFFQPERAKLHKLKSKCDMLHMSFNFRPETRA
ncbi:hypothetical protein FRX31_012183 [Thalictrum thalictroides]|uniref:R13L1/DRL21-like LRR repeat region domain-containing protein n=1 Tax=Thalictrum thalictroides TaxID=46969 RepID=A0A7J6WNQ5_THATH|nr:hypothetical protein FRX31_012183 [Thalictrum thalictroides]